MKTTTEQPNCDEGTLCWSMRVLGLGLLIGSAFFLYKDLSLGMVDNALFTVAALLGLLSFIGSWTSTGQRTMDNISQRAISRKKALRQRQRPSPQPASNRVAFSRASS